VTLVAGVVILISKNSRQIADAATDDFASLKQKVLQVFKQQSGSGKVIIESPVI